MGAAFVLLIALMFIACKQPASAEKPEPPAPPAPPKHAVTFSVEGTPPNGTLKAILGTSEITSGDKVEEGKWVIFTAKADEGYRVKEWKVDGNAILGHQHYTGRNNDTYKVHGNNGDNQKRQQGGKGGQRTE